MAVARVKKMNLPDAPKPTRATKAYDPREKEREQRLQEACGKGLNMKVRIDEGKPLCFWDRARVSKLRRLWNEGYPVKYIARECGAQEKATHNKITQEISYGRLEPRRKDLSAEDIERIYRLRDAGMSIKLIAKDMKRSAVRVKKILEERGKK